MFTIIYYTNESNLVLEFQTDKRQLNKNKEIDELENEKDEKKY